MSLLTKITLFLHVVVFIANVFLGILVVKKNSRLRANILFCIYALSLAFWNISLFFTITSIGGPTLQLWWSRLAFSFFLLMLNSFFYFTVVYPQNKKVNNWFKIFFWFVTAIIFISTLTPLLVIGDIKIIDGSITGTLGPLMQYLTWYYLLLIFLSLFVLIFKILKYKGLERVKLRYVLLGFSVFVIPSITTNVVFPIFFQIFKYNNLGPIFSFPMLVIISYAIIHYHLMDIKIFLRRGTVFTILFGTLFVILVFGTSFLNKVVPFIFAQAIAGIIIVFLFSPLKHFLEEVTDKVFFKKPYDFEKSLTEFNHLLAHTYKLKDLVGGLFDNLFKIFKLNDGALFLVENLGVYKLYLNKGDISFPDTINDSCLILEYLKKRMKNEGIHGNKIIEREEINHEYLESRDAQEKEKLRLLKEEIDVIGFHVAIPIFSKKEVVGILFLGEKKSQDSYSIQDLQLLDIISHETSFSIENLLNIEKILKLDKAKSEFIMVISHQLRTPLSVARWNTEVLLDGGYGTITDEKIRRGLEESYRGILRMTEGLNNLIMALQITEGEVGLQKRGVDFKREVIDPIVKELLTKAQKKGCLINVQCESQVEDINIVFDPLKIGFVFRSIIYNAILYSSANSIIDVFIKKEDGKIIVIVDDSGIGINHENHEDIFQKFWRGGEARIMSPDGLGLSLFISRAFIEAHGGRLWIEEKNQPGARFLFSIPINKEI